MVSQSDPELRWQHTNRACSTARVRPSNSLDVQLQVLDVFLSLSPGIAHESKILSMGAGSRRLGSTGGRAATVRELLEVPGMMVGGTCLRLEVRNHL